MPKSKIRERIYLEDLKRASKMTPAEKLKLALELSDFCRYLQSKGKNDTTKTGSFRDKRHP